MPPTVFSASTGARARWAPAAAHLATVVLGIFSVASGLGAQEAFSPTTTVRVNVNAVLGALHYEGSAVDAGANTAVGFPLLNALSLNTDTRLTLDTSFTGQDLFRVRLRSGNFGPSGFFSNPPTPLTRLDFAFEEPLCRRDDGLCNLVTVNRAYLQVPLSPEIRVTVGSRLMQLDLLPVWPSVANDSPILELFQRAGAAGAYSRRVGSGFGAWWQPQGGLRGLSIAYGAVIPLAAQGSPGEGGLFTAGAGQTNTVQLAFTRPAWNLTAAYTRNGQRALLRGTPLASQLAAESRDGALHSWSLAGYWQPLAGGWIPSISAGWGADHWAFASTPVAGLSGVRTRSWSVGLTWSEMFSPGNSLTLAVGAPAHVIELQGLGGTTVDDTGVALEASARIPLSDTFTLTPAVFWLSRPRGAMGGTSSLGEVLQPSSGEAVPSLAVWGGLVRGTLRF
ncbi:MAG: hypothetical protein ACO3ZD_08510 [Cyanobium sp.]